MECAVISPPVMTSILSHKAYVWLQKTRHKAHKSDALPYDTFIELESSSPHSQSFSPSTKRTSKLFKITCKVMWV